MSVARQEGRRSSRLDEDLLGCEVLGHHLDAGVADLEPTAMPHADAGCPDSALARAARCGHEPRVRPSVRNDQDTPTVVSRGKSLDECHDAPSGCLVCLLTV